MRLEPSIRACAEVVSWDRATGFKFMHERLVNKQTRWRSSLTSCQHSSSFITRNIRNASTAGDVENRKTSICNLGFTRRTSACGFGRSLIKMREEILFYCHVSIVVVVGLKRAKTKVEPMEAGERQGGYNNKRFWLMFKYIYFCPFHSLKAYKRQNLMMAPFLCINSLHIEIKSN